jgi:hypothetical protein
MAQTNYTPIILFNSTTAGNLPTTSNLAVGELALNVADGKLYFNKSGVITVLATQAIAAVTLPVSIANGGTGLTTIGANGTVLTSNGTTASWAATSGGITTGKSIAMAMIFGF